MIKKLGGAAVLLAMLLPGLVLGREKKQNSEPFYRRYLVAGNPLDDRILEVEKRVMAEPGSADLHNDFGNLLAARRFYKEARGQFETAMKLDRRHFLAPYNLGLLFETAGETSRAITAYEKSVDRNRGFPPSRFRLGRLYEKRGWPTRAIEQYARALQIDPAMRDPKRNPLVVDTRLLDRASLENYQRDLAAAAMAAEAVYVDQNQKMLRRVPVDRTLTSGDLKPGPDEPATMGPAAAATPVRVIAPGAPPRRRTEPPVRSQPVQPVFVPTPEFDLPAPVPTEPPQPLPTPDPSGGRPPYVGGFRPQPTPLPTPE